MSLRSALEKKSCTTSGWIMDSLNLGSQYVAFSSSHGMRHRNLEGGITEEGLRKGLKAHLEMRTCLANLRMRSAGR